MRENAILRRFKRRAAMQQLTNRNIILGVTGGIAAYKAAELVRRLREHQANVRVVMTAAATDGNTRGSTSDNDGALISPR